MVPFPYLSQKRGFSAQKDDPQKVGPVTYKFAKGSVVVDYDVKYSHHTTGRVHFSNTGRAEVLPGRECFNLKTGSGLLFSVRIFDLNGLAALREEGTARRVPTWHELPRACPAGH